MREVTAVNGIHRRGRIQGSPT